MNGEILKGSIYPLRRWASEAPTPTLSRHFLAIGKLSALYFVLAAYATWPLLRHLGDALPQGTDRAATVPLLQAWSLWWTADRMAAGFDGLWTAPIFSPTPNSFVFSDPLLGLGIVAAPLQWLGASPVLAHNVVLLLALIGNGLFAFGLLRSLELSRGTSTLGGAMMVMLPYVHHELGVLMLIPLAGILGFLWALSAFTRAPSLSAALGMGGSAAAAYLCCGQYGIFIALVLTPSALWLVRRDWLRPKPLLQLGAGALLAAALIAPLVAKQLEGIEQQQFARSERSALRSASYPSAWLATPWKQLVPTPGVDAVQEEWMQGHYPGTVRLALALCGLAWGLRRSGQRRWSALLLTAAVLASLYSALPRLGLGDVSLYGALRDVVPGLAQMRSYWRFIVVAQLAVILLAAFGFEALRSWTAPYEARSPKRRRAIRGALIVLMALGIFEIVPAAQRLAPTPDFGRWEPWSRWISENVPEDSALIYLPFPARGDVADFEESARWMLLTATHGRPMANGYSGFFPKSYKVLSRSLRGCPTAQDYELVRALGYDTLVIRSSWLLEKAACAPPPQKWERVAAFEKLDVEVQRALAGENGAASRERAETPVDWTFRAPSGSPASHSTL